MVYTLYSFSHCIQYPSADNMQLLLLASCIDDEVNQRISLDVLSRVDCV